MKNKIIIGIILILGLILRLLFVTKLPLYGDELTMVYDTYSVLKTGHDQLGNFLPITFQMGAGRPAGYVYASIPFVALFGPTALGVRGLSILSGLMLILIMYFLGKKLLGEKTGIVAAFLTAVSPWDLSLSRGGFEAHFALMLASLGLLFFLYAKDKPGYYLGLVITWGLAIHTYPTYKLTLLLILPLLLWFRKGTIKSFLSKGGWWCKGIALAVGLLAVGLSLQQTFFNKSEQRFTDINIFVDQNIKQQILQKVNLERTIDTLGGKLSIAFHNRPVEYFVLLKNAYLDNLSVNFLFVSGDGNPVHNMTGIGELYLVEMAFVIIGTIALWNKNKRIFILLIFWILFAPAAAALTGTPHALRDSFMLPPLVLLSAFGLTKILEIKKKKLRYICVVFAGTIWLIQFIFLLDKLYFLNPSKYYDFWSYPAKDAVTIANKNIGKYDYIFLSDRIDNIQYAYPVYNKIDPRTVIEENKNQNNFGKYILREYGNVYITDIPVKEINTFINSIKGSFVYIGAPTENISSSVVERVSSPTDLDMLSVVKKN